MRYRKLDENGDYTFGQAAGNFYKDQPEAVSQAVLTRLRLIQAEWFLDISAGTPYNSKVLGTGTINSYDLAIQEVILNTPGVLNITDYSSGVNAERQAFITCTINTVYGEAIVQTPL